MNINEIFSLLHNQEELTISQESEKVIYGDREQTYGEPAKNLNVVAGLWTAYTGTELNAHDVCNMMALLKIARIKNCPDHRDSKVDLIGYTLLHERI